MKSRSVKIVVVAASILTTSVLAFAGGQPNRVYTPPENEAQDGAGIARNINQGKGAGITRSNVVLRGNAYRSQTAEDTKLLRVKPGAAGPNWNDPVFHR